MSNGEAKFGPVWCASINIVSFLELDFVGDSTL